MGTPFPGTGTPRAHLGPHTNTPARTFWGTQPPLAPPRMSPPCHGVAMVAPNATGVPPRALWPPGPGLGKPQEVTGRNGGGHPKMCPQIRGAVVAVVTAGPAPGLPRSLLVLFISGTHSRRDGDGWEVTGW